MIFGLRLFAYIDFGIFIAKNSLEKTIHSSIRFIAHIVLCRKEPMQKNH